MISGLISSPIVYFFRCVECRPLFLLFFQGWRRAYINQHKKLLEKVSAITHFVKDCSQNESIEISDYLKAVAFLGSAELGFEDVQIFLFSVNTNVLMNLIGVHYSIFHLQIPVSNPTGNHPS